MYLEWIQEALEFDIFVNDYNSYSTIGLQIDQISSFYPKMYPLQFKITSFIIIFLNKQ